MVRVAWPHSQLQNQFVTKSYTFFDLTFPLLTAGKLEIINSDIGMDERMACLNFVGNLAYQANFYSVRVILELYAAFMQTTELGHATWFPYPFEVYQPILARAKPFSLESNKGT